MRTPAFVIALLLGALACVCFYSASKRQRWRAVPLPAGPTRALGGLLSWGSLVAFDHSMGFVPAVLSFIAWHVLLLVPLSYVGAALAASRQEHRHQRE